jgi:hypothetical protein
MAKQQVARTEETNVVPLEDKLPDDILKELEQDAGRGFSQNTDDSVVPLIRILQDLSPQVKNRDPAYIEGAMPGDIFVAATGTLIKGDKGMDVVPFAFQRHFVEWRPRGQGGIAGRHEVNNLPGDVEEVEREGRRQLLRENGNVLIETRYHFVLLGPQAYAIPFSSTGHQVSKQWTFMMSLHRLPDGRPMPAWGRKYRLTTQLKKNALGEWYQFHPVDLSPTSAVEIRMARTMANAVGAGEKVAEMPEEEVQQDIPF